MLKYLLVDGPFVEDATMLVFMTIIISVWKGGGTGLDCEKIIVELMQLQ